jgi:hypothetical protein
MGRVGSMLDASNNTVATASHGVANELLGLTYFGINEQLTYNSMFQLIHQYAPGGVIDMQSLLSGKVLCGPWQALWIEWDAGKTGFFDLKDFKTQFRGSTDNQALSALPVTKIA